MSLETRCEESETSRIDRLLNKLRFEDSQNHSRDYTISKKIPEFIIKHKKNYYLFPKTEVGVNLVIENNKFMIGLPRVLNENYHHPLVYNGSISYNMSKDEIEKILGFGFNKWYNLDDKKIFKYVSRAFDFAKGILKKSFRNCNITHFKKERISKSKVKKLYFSGIEIYDCDN